MNRTHLMLIAAVASNRVIGNKGALPWHLPEDLKRFRRITQGHPVIMGRKTYESIGKPLPDRHNIVVSTTMEETPGVTVVRSLDEAIRSGLDYGHLPMYVIGGASLYEEAMPRARGIMLTEVDQAPEGDVVFPALDMDEWETVISFSGETPGVTFKELKHKSEI